METIINLINQLLTAIRNDSNLVNSIRNPYYVGFEGVKNEELGIRDEENEGVRGTNPNNLSTTKDSTN